MARLWRNRWLQTQETELSGFQKLQDLQREGAPRKFSMEQVIKLFALACEPPENCGDRALNVKAATWDGYGASYNGCDCAGSHSHSISINSADSHTHGVNISSAGSHSHSVSINNGQANLSNPTNARHGSETRVKNIGLIYCIKY
jgi:hypothetical protein